MDDSIAVCDQSPRTAVRRRAARWTAAYLVLGAIPSIVVLVTRDALLRTGGFIESLPVPILLLAAAASVILAVALRRDGAPYVPWLGLGLLCLALLGEEAKWGYEPVFGFQLFSGDGWDLHNRLAYRYLQRFSPIALDSAGGVAIVSIAGATAIACVALYAARRIAARRAELPVVFLLVALVFALLGLTIDILDLATERFFENRIGIMKWAVEEMSEIMVALALLFAPLVRLLAPR